MAGNQGSTRKDREDRLVRVEEMMLRGIKNLNQIAVAHGISVPTAHRDVKEIRRRWGDRDPDERGMLIQERVVQFESILTKALNAFDRSRRDVEEFTVVVHPCTDCHEAGKIEDPVGSDIWKTCRHCGGKGRRVQQTTKVKESPGDPAFLKIAQSCVVEVGKIQGLYGPTTTASGAVLRRVTETEGVGGSIREELEEFYLTAPAEGIVAALAAIDNLRNGKSGPTDVLDATAKLIPSYNEGVQDEQPHTGEDDDDRSDSADLRDDPGEHGGLPDSV